MNDLKSILLPGVDNKRPLVIAGPCSAETEEQVMATATALAEKGIKIFRAGIWKPRTKPGGFEGVGQAKAVIFTILVAMIALLQLYTTRRKEIEN